MCETSLKRRPWSPRSDATWMRSTALVGKSSNLGNQLLWLSAFATYILYQHQSCKCWWNCFQGSIASRTTRLPRMIFLVLHGFGAQDFHYKWLLDLCLLTKGKKGKGKGKGKGSKGKGKGKRTGSSCSLCVTLCLNSFVERNSFHPGSDKR